MIVPSRDWLTYRTARFVDAAHRSEAPPDDADDHAFR
jgi:hypothetical protein